MATYTNPNFRCATKGCGHFVADHSAVNPKTDELEDGTIRYRCHANGSGCTCKAYIDSGSTGDAVEDAAIADAAKAAEAPAAPAPAAGA